MQSSSPKARHRVIHWQPWPPARHTVAVHLCTLAGKDLQRPIFESQPNIAHDLSMHLSAYGREERALVKCGFARRDPVPPGGQYPNGHPAPKGGRVLHVDPAWLKAHAEDVPPREPTSTGSGSGRKPSPAQARANMAEQRERARLLDVLLNHGLSDEEIRRRLEGPLGDAPVELLAELVKGLEQPPTAAQNGNTTDPLRSPAIGSVSDSCRSPSSPASTDPAGSLIRADHQDTTGKEESYDEGVIFEGDRSPTPVTHNEAVNRLLKGGWSMHAAEGRLECHLRDASVEQLLELVAEREGRGA